jgi:hypothetical protein
MDCAERQKAILKDEGYGRNDLCICIKRIRIRTQAYSGTASKGLAKQEQEQRGCVDEAAAKETKRNANKQYSQSPFVVEFEYGANNQRILAV